MSSGILKKFAEKEGWQTKKNFAYGEVNNYLFTLVNLDQYISVITPFPSLDNTGKEQILKYLNDNKKKLGIFNFKFDKVLLIIKIKRKFLASNSILSMENLLDNLTNYFKLNNYDNNHNCIFCSKEDANEKIYLNDISFYAHNQCYIEEANKIYEAINTYDSKGKNYLIGFFGAILGALVCSLPWIIVQLYFNVMAALLVCLISVGSYKAYRIFKGRLGSLTKYIILISTIIGVGVSQIVILVISMMQAEIPLSLENIEYILQDQKIQESMTHNLIIALIMAAVGFYYVIRILKTNITDVMPQLNNSLN